MEALEPVTPKPTDTITLREGPELSTEAVVALYDSVGWALYTRDTAALRRAIVGSLWVATAWSGEALVGLVRVVGDDVSIAYIQDILVHPAAQRRGVGRRLLEAALARFAHVRQKVLITEDEPRQHAFYEALGLTDTRKLDRGTVRTFVRFDVGKLN